MALVPATTPTARAPGRRPRQEIARDLLFSNLRPEIRSQLHIDHDSYRYITSATLATRINQIFSEIMGPLTDLVLTDITAGVGGDVIDSAQVFRLVHAIERSADRCLHLAHNIRICGLDHRVCIYHSDSMSLLRAGLFTQDIIFFDPPWAGSGCPRGTPHPRLYFSGDPIETVTEELVRDHARLVGVKLPRNYELRWWDPLCRRYPHHLYHLGSFYLFCFWRPDI